MPLPSTSSLTRLTLILTSHWVGSRVSTGCSLATTHPDHSLLCKPLQALFTHFSRLPSRTSLLLPEISTYDHRMVRAFPTSRHLIAYYLAPVPIDTNRCLGVQLPPAVTASYCDREIVIINVFQMCLLSGTEAERSESQSILLLLLMGRRALRILHLREKLRKGEEQVPCLQSSGSSFPPKPLLLPGPFYGLVMGANTFLFCQKQI